MLMMLPEKRWDIGNNTLENNEYITSCISAVGLEPAEWSQAQPGGTWPAWISNAVIVLLNRGNMNSGHLCGPETTRVECDSWSGPNSYEDLLAPPDHQTLQSWLNKLSVQPWLATAHNFLYLYSLSTGWVCLQASLNLRGWGRTWIHSSMTELAGVVKGFTSPLDRHSNLWNLLGRAYKSKKLLHTRWYLAWSILKQQREQTN